MKLVSAESQISHNDRERMQVQHRAAVVCRRIDYSWAFNDAMVQKVIGARIAMITVARKIPETLDTLRALDSLAVRKLAAHKSKHNRMCAAAAGRVGGLAPYLAALIYRAIRLGEDSVAVATALGVTPWAIRQTLWRLNWTAKHLAAGTLRLPKAPYRRRKGSKCGPLPLWDLQEVVAMRNAGFAVDEIGAKFGVTGEAISMGLSRAGIVCPRARRSRSAKTHKYSHQEAMAMRLDGATYQEIADRFGVTVAPVWNTLNKGPLAAICGAPPACWKSRLAQSEKQPG